MGERVEVVGGALKLAGRSGCHLQEPVSSCVVGRPYAVGAVEPKLT